MRNIRPLVASAARTVSDGHDPSESGIQPMRRRTWCGSVTGSYPAMRMEPASGASNDPSMSSSVVLPAPLGR